MAIATEEARRPTDRPDRRGGRDPERRSRHLRVVRRAGLPPADRRGRRAAHRALERARREGLPRRQPARALRRGRARHARPPGRRRGDLGRRMLAAPDRGLPRDRRLDHHPPRHRGAARGVAPGHRGGHDEGRVRDHRARRRHQLPQPLDHRYARRRQVHPQGPEDLHLGRRGRRRDPRDRPQARGRRVAGAASPDARRRRFARPREAAHPGRGQDLRQAVAALLRRGRGPGRPRGRRVGDRWAQGRVRRAQPRADHGRLDLERRRAPRARARARRTRTSARSGATRRSAPTRASRIRSPRPRSSTSWPG